MRSLAVAYETWARIGFEPNAAQRPILLDEHDLVQGAGGWRAGKSRLAASGKLMGEMLTGNLFWLVGAKYEMTRPEFDYVSQDVAKLYPNGVKTRQVQIHGPREGPCYINISNEILIETKSADDPRTLAGKAPDGVVICEAGQVLWDTVERCLGRVLEKRGWVFAIGTFEESVGWYVDKWFEWQKDNVFNARSYSLPTWSNTALFPEGVNDPWIQRMRVELGDDKFQEKLGGVPHPPTSRVYARFEPRESGNVRAIELLKIENDDQVILSPVQLWIDPGFACYAVEAVQKAPGEHGPIYRLFKDGELYAPGIGSEEAIGWVKSQEWSGAIERIVIDVASKQHHGGRPIANVWAEAFNGIAVDAHYIHKKAAIDKVQSVIETRRLLVDPSRRGLIAEMGCGTNPIPGQTYFRWKQRGGGIITDLTEDDSDHACSAVNYGIIANESYLPRGADIAPQRAYDWTYGPSTPSRSR